MLGDTNDRSLQSMELYRSHVDSLCDATTIAIDSVDYVRASVQCSLNPPACERYVHFLLAQSQCHNQ